MASLEVLSQKVRIFYANVDPTKTQGEMDQIVFSAYSNGEASVNEQLMSKYGMDLNTFYTQDQMVAYPVVPQSGGAPSSVPVAMAMPVTNPAPTMVQTPNGIGYVTAAGTPGAVPVMITENGAQRVLYVLVPGTTPFSSSQAHYDYQRQQDQRNADLCCCLALLATCCLCIDF